MNFQKVHCFMFFIFEILLKFENYLYLSIYTLKKICDSNKIILKFLLRTAFEKPCIDLESLIKSCYLHIKTNSFKISKISNIPTNRSKEFEKLYHV